MMMNKILFHKDKSKNFGRVRKHLSKIPNIHQGGCGIATLAMYQWLKNNSKLPKDFHVAYYYSPEIIYVLLEMNADIENPSGSCTHALIYWNGEYRDCDGVFLTKCPTNSILYQKVEAEAIEPFLKKTISFGSWNAKFDRSEWSKYIRKTLNVEL